MSLRDINHQAAIELGLRDTEYITALKYERDQLNDELADLRVIKPERLMLETVARVEEIEERLVRIKELLEK